MAQGVLVERMEQQVGGNREQVGSFPTASAAVVCAYSFESRVAQSLPTQLARLGRLPFADAGLCGVNAQEILEPA